MNIVLHPCYVNVLKIHLDSLSIFGLSLLVVIHVVCLYILQIEEFYTFLKPTSQLEICFPVLISQDWVDSPTPFEEHLRFYIYKTPMCGLLFQTGKTQIFIFNVVPSPLGCFCYTLCLLCSLIYKIGINNSMSRMVCDIN